jgi:hypothetical protein
MVGEIGGIMRHPDFQPQPIRGFMHVFLEEMAVGGVAVAAEFAGIVAGVEVR